MCEVFIGELYEKFGIFYLEREVFGLERGRMFLYFGRVVIWEYNVEIMVLIYEDIKG